MKVTVIRLSIVILLLIGFSSLVIALSNVSFINQTVSNSTPRVGDIVTFTINATANTYIKNYLFSYYNLTEWINTTTVQVYSDNISDFMKVYYTMDDVDITGTVVDDLSSSDGGVDDHNGTTDGDLTTGINGILNEAIYVNGDGTYNTGVGGYAQVSNVSAIVDDTEGTACIWFKTTNPGVTYGTLWSVSRSVGLNYVYLVLRGDAAYREHLFLDMGSDQNHLWLYNASSFNIWNGEWHHVCLATDRLWVDGTNVTRDFLGGGPGDGFWFNDNGGALLDRFTVGSLLYDSKAASYSFNGSLDEFAYWDRQLTDVEVEFLYSNGAPIVNPYETVKSSILTYEQNLSVAGTFNYSWWVEDEWVRSDYYSIIVSSADNMIFINPGTNNTIPRVNEDINFNITISDDDGLSSYIFSFFNGTWNNQTAVAISGTSITVNATQTMLSSAGTFNYTWYANDTLGTWTQSSIFDVYVNVSADTAPSTPTAATVNNSAPFTNDIINCSASGSVDDQSDSITYFYKFNSSTNETIQDFSSTTEFDCSSKDCDKGDNIFCYAMATTLTFNSSIFQGENFTVQNTLPAAPTNIEWATLGGFTSGTRIYGQTLDFINATCSGVDPDNDFTGCSVTVTSPTLTIVDNQSMTNSSTEYTYTNDISLTEAGTWTITIYALDSEGSTSTSDTIEVEIVIPSLFDGFYAYDYQSIPDHATITTDFLIYVYDTIGLTLNWSRLSSDYGSLKETINSSKDNHSIKSFITLYFDGTYDPANNYTNTTCGEVNANLSDFVDTPYDESIRFILMELNDSQSYKVNFTNSIATCIVNATANRFPVYVDYADAAIDDSWSTTYNLITITTDSNVTYINLEHQYLSTNSSLTRVYYSMSTELRTLAYNYQSNIIAKIRGTPTTDYVADGVAEISNGDLIVYNNQSTEQTFTLSVADALRTGKDVWDSTQKTFIESNTDGTINVTVPTYSFSNVYFDNIDHFTLTGVWEAAANVQFSYGWNRTGDTQATYSIVGANDAQFYAWDPTYGINNQFMIHYEWINSSLVINYTPYCEAGSIIIADYNTYGLDTAIGCKDVTSGYISVADYNDTQGWEDAKEAAIDTWVDDFGINVFLDGLDTGASGNNFAERFRRLVDYLEIEKNATCIANDYTSYSSVGVGGICDYDMKESFCGRWDGSVGSPSYSWEVWSVDYDRAVWADTNNNPQLAMTFGNSTDNDKQAYCYAMYLVLYGTTNGNLWRYGQPNFQSQQEIFTFDPGDQLENTWTETNSSYFYRKYGNGKVWINPDSHGWGIENNRVMNNLSLRLKMQIYASSPAASTPVRISVNGLYLDPITYDEIGSSQWATGIVTRDLTSNYTQDGKYVIQLHSETPANPSGLNLYNTKYAKTGVFSFWDNSVTNPPTDGSTTWTTYGRTGVNSDYDTTNWHITLDSDDTTSSLIDNEITDITQTETTSGGKTNLTLSATKSYNITIWSNSVTLANFINLTYWNGSMFIQMNPVNTTTCDTNNPTWASDVIGGETHKSCIDSSNGNYTVRVAVPSLSTQTYQIDENTPPEISNIAINVTPYQDEDVLIQADVIDTGAINNVTLEFNGTNYTMSNIGGDTYAKAISSGNYSTRQNMTYRIYALDEIFTTVSDLYSFVVNNYAPTAPVNGTEQSPYDTYEGAYINGTDMNITFTKGTDQDDNVTTWISLDSSGYTYEGDTYKSSTNGTIFENLDLNSSKYYVRLWSTDEYLNSSSDEFTFRVAESPDNVENLTNVTTQDHRIILEWDYPMIVANAELYKNGSLLANLTYPTATYTDYPVNSTTSYLYEIYVVDTIGRRNEVTVDGESSLVVTTPEDLTDANITVGPSDRAVTGQVIISFETSEYTTADLSIGLNASAYDISTSSTAFSEEHEITLARLPSSDAPYYYNVTLTDLSGRVVSYGSYTFQAPLTGGSGGAGSTAVGRALDLDCSDLGMVLDEGEGECVFSFEMEEAEEESDELIPGLVSFEHDYIGVQIGENLIKITNVGRIIWPTSPGLGWVIVGIIAYMIINLLIIGTDYTTWWMFNKAKKP